MTRPADLRPPHLRPRLIALVALGGAVGTAVRALVVAALPGPGAGWPWATWAVNLTGAFLLGALLEHVARAGPDDGRPRDARLLLGVGVLGGYTTYSTLALETATLTADGATATAVLYGVTTLVLGVAAAGAGMAVGARRGRPGGGAGGASTRPGEGRP